MTTYLCVLREAERRSARLGLPLAPLVLSEGLYCTPEFRKQLSIKLGQLYGSDWPRKVANNCMQCTFDILEFVKQNLGVDACYTLGSVELNGIAFFVSSEEKLIELLKNDTAPKNERIHAWLTLPSLELVDFVLPSSHALRYGCGGLGEIELRKPQDMGSSLIYRPLICGTEFLFQSGLAKKIPNGLDDPHCAG